MGSREGWPSPTRSLNRSNPVRLDDELGPPEDRSKRGWGELAITALVLTIFIVGLVDSVRWVYDVVRR